MQEKIKNKLSKLEIGFLLFCFVFYFIWAIVKPFNYAPDEYMRYAVSEFLYINNRLPVGRELLGELWGFSYAQLPTMLCNLLSYIPMKIVGAFTQNEFAIIVAARMVSVASGTGVVYFTIKTAKILFNSSIRWIMIVFVSMIPQFVFLCSYLNNDIVALLGSAMILYSWTIALKYSWNLKNVLLLAVGISVCALSYYNSYGWILCSIVFFVGSYWLQRPHNYKEMLKYGVLLSFIVLLCISYMFIRHLLIYGDLLGLNTVKKYGELYAVDYLKPSNRGTCMQNNTSLIYMLFNMQWLKTTWLSFIEVFGYMNVYAAPYIYYVYTLIIVMGLLGCVILLKWKIKNEEINDKEILFIFCLVICIIIPILLSVYYSYATDFQPQGRYCYPAILSLAVFVTCGNGKILDYLSAIGLKKDIFMGFYVGVLMTITFIEFWYSYLPS